MKATIQIVLFLLAFMPVSSSAAGKGKLADKILRQMGFPKKLDGLHQQFQQALSQGKPLGKKVSARLKKNLNSRRLFKGIKKKLTASTDLETLKHASQWYTSPLGKKILRLEENVQRSFTAKSPKNADKVSQKRQKTAEKLQKHTTKNFLRYFRGITRAISYAALKRQLGKKVPEKKIQSLVESELNKQENYFKQVFQKYGVNLVLKTYAPLKDAELTRYENFMNHPKTKKFLDRFTNAFQNEIAQSVQKAL